MKFTQATIAAAVAFLPLINAHLVMTNPGTYQGADNMPPLAEDGSNYPCTDLGDNGPGETYEPGSSQSIRLAGTAVHSGGSCQISFTYDNPPTKNSVFKVVKSFHGNCPVASPPGGNFPPFQSSPLENPLPPLDFVVPSDLPSGPAVVAWTWFNKTGNREMYMRCARVTIGGSNNDRSPYDRLPDMFKAHIGNGCSIAPGVEIAFPNPGANVVGSANGQPEGNCGSSGPSPPPQQNNPSPPPQQNNPPPPPPPSGGACAEGSIICKSATTWAMCAGGTEMFMGPVAAGTTCQGNQIVKRSVRFSKEHMERKFKHC